MRALAPDIRMSFMFFFVFFFILRRMGKFMVYMICTTVLVSCTCSLFFVSPKTKKAIHFIMYTCAIIQFFFGVNI